DLSIPRHYCSSSFKDRVQLRRRIMRRARNIARPGDLITEDGTLLKGIVEGRNREKIKRLLSAEFEVPDELMFVDEEKRRVEVAPWVLEEIAASLPYDAFIVEEYPTADRLEVERERLSSRPTRR
ncbi:MAG: radical SAM protein, partial [Euryarchaeota archaeon]|nr:radical SAM protein [Euryarchaeota archaeon]